MKSQKNVYTHGHHESVLQSHKWRTVENSAQFLVKHLQPNSTLLDAGCGPGNITAEISELIPDGKIVGVDYSREIIDQARREYPDSHYKNLEFKAADIYELDFADHTFDVVYMHQVLQHLQDPVSALVELRRVLKPGGILACREADYGLFGWYPELPALDRWRELYREVTQRNNSEANGGRFLKSWIMQAGAHIQEISCETWVFSSEQDRNWWGNLWSKRVTQSDFAKQAVKYGLSNPQELERISKAFLEWAIDPKGLWTIPNVEVIATN